MIEAKNSRIVDSFLSPFNNSKAVNNRQICSLGYEILRLLEKNNELYHQLPFDDWLRITDKLLALDDLLSKGVAWGNFVIKINICNKVINRIANILLRETESLSNIKLIKLIALQKQLRSHFPSRISVLKIAFRHYAISNLKDINTFQTKVPVADLHKTIKIYYKDANYYNEKFLERLQEILMLEHEVILTNYSSIYNNPIPFSSVDVSYYFYSWELYLYSLIMLDHGIGIEIAREVSDSSIQYLLNREITTQSKFWMTRHVKDYLGNPETYASYIHNVKKMNSIKMILSRQDRGLPNMKNSSNQLMSIHQFP